MIVLALIIDSSYMKCFFGPTSDAATHGNAASVGHLFGGVQFLPSRKRVMLLD